MPIIVGHRRMGVGRGVGGGLVDSERDGACLAIFLKVEAASLLAERGVPETQSRVIPLTVPYSHA